MNTNRNTNTPPRLQLTTTDYGDGNRLGTNESVSPMRDDRRELMRHLEGLARLLTPGVETSQALRDSWNGKLPRSQSAWSAVVCDCMKLRGTDALRCIFDKVQISSLRFTGPLKEDAFEALWVAMPDNVEVNKVEIDGISFSKGSAERLLAIMCRMKELMRLSLCNVSVKGFLGQQVKLGSHWTLGKLCSLQVSDKGAPSKTTSVYPLLRAILKGAQLQEIDISTHDSISKRAHKALAVHLKSQYQLTHLRMGTHLDSSTFAAYATFLESNSTLTHLQFSNLRLGNADCNRLIKALLGNKTLTDLSLRDSRFQRDSEQLPLLDQLMLLENLRRLDLGDNSTIPDQALMLMFQKLSTNTSLIELNLDEVLLTSSDCELALLDALHDNTTLESIDVSKHLFPIYSIKKLARVMESNRVLLRLNLPPSYYLTLQYYDEFKTVIRCIQRNRKARVEQPQFRTRATNGMAAVLNGMGGVQAWVPKEVAEFFALGAAERNGHSAIVQLSSLTKQNQFPDPQNG
jgi:Ran GTPase-activating protein (RanGAP) involved in mRNA processing and transport